MLVGNARVFGVDGKLSVAVETPGVLFANAGAGGGGINPVVLSDDFLGCLLEEEEEVVARCGLSSAGKAGGVSSDISSPVIVFVSPLSSSESGSSGPRDVPRKDASQPVP